MDGLKYLLSLASKYAVMQISCMGENTLGEEIFKISYSRESMMGTEWELRNKLTTAIILMECKRRYNE